MAYGLKIWDGNSNVILDTTDRIIRYHSTVSLSTIGPFQTLSINVPGLAIDGTWFFVLNGGLSFIYMYVTPNYLNFYNTIEGSYDGTGTNIEIFRG